jgi:hypothetical protein
MQGDSMQCDSSPLHLDCVAPSTLYLLSRNSPSTIAAKDDFHSLDHFEVSSPTDL